MSKKTNTIPPYGAMTNPGAVNGFFDPNASGINPPASAPRAPKPAPRKPVEPPIGRVVPAPASAGRGLPRQPCDASGNIIREHGAYRPPTPGQGAAQPSLGHLSNPLGAPASKTPLASLQGAAGKPPKK